MKNIPSDLSIIQDWAKEVSFAVTICDCEGYVLYMNDKAKATFAKSGDVIGKNLKDCHSPRSWEIILDLLATGRHNMYTIDKAGLKKLIYQTPWYKDGKLGGLVEISIVLDENMPNYVRG